MKYLSYFVRTIDYLPHVFLITFISMLLSKSFSILFLPLVFANIALIAAAFLFNEIEDAEDDKRDSVKKKKNPFSLGKLNKRIGYLVTFMLLIIALGFYFLIDKTLFFIYTISGLLSVLYSWKAIRLKSKPIVDVLCHGIIWGTLSLSGYYLITKQFGLTSFLLFIMVTVISSVQELLNQLRDFYNDRKSKFKTTVFFLGKSLTKKIIIIFTLIDVLLIGYLFYILLPFQIFILWSILFYSIILLAYLPLLTLQTHNLLELFQNKYSLLYLLVIISVIFYFAI